MRKKFLPIPPGVDLNNITKSVKSTGYAQIDPEILRFVQTTKGLE